MTPLNPIVLHQFEAAMRTLKQAIDDCPDAVWNAEHLDGPFSQVAFHVLIMTDIHLGRDNVSVKDQDFHRQHSGTFADYEELEDRIPVRTYGRGFILDYLSHVLAKGRTVVANESEAELYGDSGFSFRPFPRLELHLYSIRHLQHHAAQLGLRNQVSAGVELKWRGSGWKD